MRLQERDTPLAAACQCCMCLHSPLDPGVEDDSESELASWPAYACLSDEYDLCLPSSTSLSVCRLLAKAYLRKENYATLLSQANRFWAHILPDCKIVNTLEYRIFDGTLFLTNETFVAPLQPDGTITSRAAYLLNACLEGTFSRGDVCQHMDWRLLGVEIGARHRSWAGPGPGAFREGAQFAMAHKCGNQNVGVGCEQGHICSGKCACDSRLASGSVSNDVVCEITSEVERIHLTASQESGNGNDDRTDQGSESISRRRNTLCNGKEHTRQCYDTTPVPLTRESLSLSLECALLHSVKAEGQMNCPDESCDVAWLIGPLEYPNALGSCDRCATDYCLGVQEIDGVGRVLILTIWKNFGGFEQGSHSKWATHWAKAEHLLSAAEANDLWLQRIFRGAGHPDQLYRPTSREVKHALEGTDSEDFTRPNLYRPKLDDPVLAALKGAPNAEGEDWHWPAEDW